jgi:hypothetical protein
MWNVVRNLFAQEGGRPDLAANRSEVWAPIIVGEDTGRTFLVRVLFTLDPRFSCDPVFLSKAQHRIVAASWDEKPSPTDLAVRALVRNDWPERVPHVQLLPSSFVASISLFLVTLEVPKALVLKDFELYDHNASFLRVRCHGSSMWKPEVEVVGTVPATLVAWRRIDAIKARGAQKVAADLMQANANLYEPGTGGRACLVLFTFDPNVSREDLADLSARLGEWKYAHLVDPDEIAAAAAPHASEAGWRYHRRFRMPASKTRGAAIYAGDLWVHRPFLAEGRVISRAEAGAGYRTLPCYAEPGDQGGLELIPYDDAAAQQARITDERIRASEPDPLL